FRSLSVGCRRFSDITSPPDDRGQTSDDPSVSRGVIDCDRTSVRNLRGALKDCAQPLPRQSWSTPPRMGPVDSLTVPGPVWEHEERTPRLQMATVKVLQRAMFRASIATGFGAFRAPVS